MIVELQAHSLSILGGSRKNTLTDSNVLRTNKNSHWTEQPQSQSKQMRRWLHTTIREQPSALLHDESKALKTLKATSKSYLAVELCSGGCTSATKNGRRTNESRRAAKFVELYKGHALDIKPQ